MLANMINIHEQKIGQVSQEFLKSLAISDSASIPFLAFDGNLSLVHKPIVSVVGTRAPTPMGIARTEKVVDCLVKHGFVVMSGLAKGIDTVAHQSTLNRNGLTIAVLGTPIHKIYPAENKALAKTISEKGLLLSPAEVHDEVGKHLFPRRNRVMAILSKATIVIEAGATSGVQHQAVECLRNKRKLFYLKSLADRADITWVQKFIKSGAIVIETDEQLIKAMR
jgi:DNA processing protein